MQLWPSTPLGLGAAATLLLMSSTGLESNEGGGLHTEFGEVRLQHLAIGKTYSVARLAAAPLVIRNTSSETLNVCLEIEIPHRHELRDGALPLPGRGWVHIEPTQFRLAAGDMRRTDVHVSVPYDPELVGKTYQVDFRPHMIDASGNAWEAGYVHTLLFTVEMDYRDDTEAQFAFRRSRCSGR